MSYETVLAEQITRLPKWAQRHIQSVTADRDCARAKLAEGPEDSDTFADPYGTPRPLGRGTRIEFRTRPERREYITVRLGADGALYVMGSDSLVIEPQSSNTFSVRLSR